MAGMSEVGRLFNNNELIVAEVLQSAEAMKAAVSHLEQFMEKADTAARGKVILATVKGDVHDIGKNLVEIILANNGYQVVNLGIKVPPEVLIRACQEHQPDAIGLSGLLVKSTQQMAITAGDFKAAGITVPLLVGGAALSEKFTRTRIAPAYGEAVCYAKDAMTGLSLMNAIMDPERRGAVLESHRVVEVVAPGPEGTPLPPVFSSPLLTRSTKVRTAIPIPAAPYLERKVRGVPHLAEVWSYINPFMLYGRHLGYKGNFEKALLEHEPKALELFHNMEQVKREAARFMQVKAVWQFFEAERDGNAIQLFAPGGGAPLHTFRFGRQPRENGLCLSRLHSGCRRRPPRPPGAVRSHGRRRHSRAVRAVQASGRVLQSARHPGAGHRNGRRRGGVAAPADSRGLGLPRPAGAHHARPLHVEVSRQALQFRLSGLPQPGRPAGPLHSAPPRRHRRATHRRHDDGPRSQRERAGIPPPGLRVLHGGLWGSLVSCGRVALGPLPFPYCPVVPAGASRIWLAHPFFSTWTRAGPANSLTTSGYPASKTETLYSPPASPSKTNLPSRSDSV